MAPLEEQVIFPEYENDFQVYGHNQDRDILTVEDNLEVGWPERQPRRLMSRALITSVRLRFLIIPSSLFLINLLGDLFSFSYFPLNLFRSPGPSQKTKCL